MRVLRQGPWVPNEDEYRRLGQPTHRRALVREVVLLADGVPVVLAHSIAAWRALFQLVVSPAHWEKTPHGIQHGPDVVQVD